MTKKNIINNSILAFTSFVAALLVPLFMIGVSPNDYKFIEFNTLLKISLKFSLVSFLILFFFNFIFIFLKLYKTSNAFTYFIFSYVVLSGFVFPISVSDALANPYDALINPTNLILVIIFSLILSYLSLKNFENYIFIFLTVTIIFSSLQSIYNTKQSENNIFSSKYKKKQFNDQALELSDQKNIFIISFDGVTGKSFNDAVTESDLVSKNLKDFILFTNVISHAPFTKISHLADIYGFQNFDKYPQDLKVIKDSLLNELYNFTPASYIVDSFQYNYPGYGIKGEIPLLYSGRNHQITFDFFQYPIVRMGSRFILKMLTYSNFLKYIENKSISNEMSSELERNLIYHFGPSFDKEYILDILNYDYIVDNMKVTPKDISLRYLHFTFSHNPVDFDEHCNYKSNVKSWFFSNQNEAALKKETFCVIKKINSFIHKLKKLNIYDKSLIIFKSDHGHPSNYFSNQPNNLEINNNIIGYSRHTPFLLIKDFDSKQKKIILKSNLTLLNDIPKTICIKLKMIDNCNVFNGIDLFDDQLNADTPYYVLISKNEKPNCCAIKNFQLLKVPTRKISLLDALKNKNFVMR